MAAVTYQTETLLGIYDHQGETTVGQLSDFTNKVHPGSNKKIQGWQWDRRTWPTSLERDGLEIVPSILDASEEGLPPTYYQSGYGDGYDLQMLAVLAEYLDGESMWVPELYKGFFYSYNEEWYLYGDDYQTEYLTASGVVSGFQTHQLTYIPKVDTPIRVANYEWNKAYGRFEIDNLFDHKVTFTGSGNHEFRTDKTTTPPTVYLDGEYGRDIGYDITPVSGVVSPASQLLDFEFLGVSDGTSNQRFKLQYSPVDPDMPAEIWSHIGGTEAVQWTLTGWNASLSGYQAKLDWDHGIIEFGDGVSGIIPTSSHVINARYSQGVAVQYDPTWGRDTIAGFNTNLSPVHGGLYQGFVQVATGPGVASSILISADDLLLDGVHTLDIGNNTAQIEATVYSKAGEPIESIPVTFELLSPAKGGFNGQNTTELITTTTAGNASTTYHSPTTISEVGQATIEVFHDGADTLMEVSGLSVPSNLEDLVVYKIHETDENLGILESDVSGVYSGFFTDEGITGNTATVDWEQNHRELHNLGVPLPYTSGDIVTGKKTLLMTTGRSTVVSPHTGAISGSAPYYYGALRANTIEDISIDDDLAIRATFSGINLDLPTVNDTKSYYVVAGNVASVRAYVLDENGKKVYSNTINIQLTVPDTMNGTYFADALADVPSGLLWTVKDIDDVSDAFIDSTSGVYQGEYLEDQEDSETYRQWFRRTQKFNSEVLGLTFVPLTAEPAEIPLGWRLPSSGVTIASILEQITFLEPNSDLPSGYYA